MKTKLRKFGAWLMAAALAFAGAGAYGATQVADQAALNAAVETAVAGDVIKLAAGDFTAYGQKWSTQGRSFIFEGTVDEAGNLLTTWKYGPADAGAGEGGLD